MSTNDGAGELLDVVDEADRVIGVATRGEVHALGLRHRAVHILIEDRDARLYVQRRAAHKDCDPGLWDSSAAGHVVHGEDYASAARRELAEELGLHDVALEELFALPPNAATGHEFVRVYLGLALREPCPDAHEISATRWCGQAGLGEWMAREPNAFTATFHAICACRRARLA